MKYCSTYVRTHFLLFRIDRLPSVNLSAPTNSTVRQVFGVELPNPNFPWNEDSRVQNLVMLNEASRANSSYISRACSINEVCVCCCCLPHVVLGYDCTSHVMYYTAAPHACTYENAHTN